MFERFVNLPGGFTDGPAGHVLRPDPAARIFRLDAPARPPVPCAPRRRSCVRDRGPRGAILA
jgi:hypothetical protein